MKNYDELTNDLLERRDRYVADQKKKRRKVLSVATSLFCFCLVAFLGFGMWQGGVFSGKSPFIWDDSTIIGEKNHINPDELNNSSQTTTSGNHNSSGDNAPVDKDDMLGINRVEGQIGAAKLNFSTDKYYSEKKTLADVSAYFGRDLSTLEAVMPQGFEFFGSYETNFFYKLDGELVYDSCVFGYKKDDQQITIKVSKIGVPYDCIYKLKDSTVSNVNGVEVTMGGIYTGDSENFELVFADFSHEGLQYRVTAENVPDDGNKDAVLWLVGIINELAK